MNVTLTEINFHIDGKNGAAASVNGTYGDDGIMHFGVSMWGFNKDDIRALRDELYRSFPSDYYMYHTNDDSFDWYYRGEDKVYELNYTYTPTTNSIKVGL